MVRALLTAIFLTLFSQTTWAGLFDSYPRGKKGEVIAEMWSYSRNEWDPVVLFFGYGNDWEFCEEYLEMLKKQTTYKYRCVENK